MVKEKMDLDKKKESLNKIPIFIGYIFAALGIFMNIFAFIIYFLNKGAYTFQRDLQVKLLSNGGIGFVILGMVVLAFFHFRRNKKV